MASLNDFNAAANVESVRLYSPVPAGLYLAEIIASEMRPTTKGSGSYLLLTFRITDGEHQGRLLWTLLNLVNVSPRAVQFARAELAAIYEAVDVVRPNDSEELHHRPLLITVTQRRRSDTGEVINDIKGYSRLPATNGQPRLQL
jgi:hypothetical protein